jgi:hypothetical protein
MKSNSPGCDGPLGAGKPRLSCLYAVDGLPFAFICVYSFGWFRGIVSATNRSGQLQC